MDEMRELGWDDEISNESGVEYILLPPGDYDFTVVDFERARHEGSVKLPPCNKAILTLSIKTNEGEATIKHNLFLHQKTEGILCAFFRAIGQKKHGEPLRMDWSKVRGATGRCQIYVDEYLNQNKEKRQSNKIKKFYEKEASAPKAYTPGSF